MNGLVIRMLEHGHVTLIVLAQPFQFARPATQLWEDPLALATTTALRYYCRFLPQIYSCMLSKGIQYLISQAGGGRKQHRRRLWHHISNVRIHAAVGSLAAERSERAHFTIDAWVPASRNGCDITAQEQKHQANDVMRTNQSGRNDKQIV